MFGSLGAKSKLITADRALPGRAQRIAVPDRHAVLGSPLAGPFPDGTEQVMLALGCFWGAEKTFWSLPGVFTTAVGYSGGFTPNPTYEEVCSGSTGHAETVLVAFDPAKIAFAKILAAFWEGHDPTQGMRQGNDIGTQYRSAIYYTTEQQQQLATGSRDTYQSALRQAGHGQITTAIEPAGEFYYAEDYHQQYLAKNPGGYCGHGGTGVSCPVGLGVG